MTKELQAYVTPPEGWVVEEQHHVGRFVTAETYRLPDGSTRTWSSRRHRKRLELGERLEGSSPERWLSLAWAPDRFTWWMAILFMVGSALFMLGSFPSYADSVSVNTDLVTYFVGSLFFTSAAYISFLEVIDADRGLSGPASDHRFRFFAWEPDRIDWWSASVQSLGTLFFNLSTGSALFTSTDVQSEHLVWAPDMLGSVCFLTASTLAWLEVCHGWWRFDVRDVSWWIVALNMLGSIAFQISALAAFIRPSTGEIANVDVATLGTFIGAACFLVGAYLLIPEMRSR